MLKLIYIRIYKFNTLLTPSYYDIYAFYNKTLYILVNKFTVKSLKFLYKLFEDANLQHWRRKVKNFS